MNGSSTDTSKFLKSLLGDKMHSGLLQPASGVVREKHGTLSNGSRIVLKPKSVATKQREDRIIDEIAAVSGGGVVDMAALWEKVRVEEAAKVGMEEFEENRDGLEDVARELNGARGKVANTLWTEKYRPRKFIELIGNEKVNASILKWLNEWNYAVKKGKLINNNDYDKESLYNDPLKRPQRKVLLIHGPPGIGKTTIAQCVCKQLGYEMQEINSSDERSGQSVKDRIRNVIKMRSLSGKDVCLLLDEIDGANGSENGFVRSLIYMLNKDARVTDEWNSFGKLKYNKKEDFIRRPIIAMCNDIGSHCLEALKPYCEIVSFKKSNRKSIKKRLKMILEKENVKNVNESLLDDLIISLDGDIRNCINFLQFNSKSLTGKVKDMEIIWFQMIKEIFNIDNVNNKNGGRSKSKSEIFNKLMSKLINSNSDLSKINMGCFNLLLQINEDDDGSSLNKIDELSEWLFFEDMTHSSSMTINKDDIAGYNSILALKFFNLFTNLNDGISTYDKKRTLNFKSSEKFDKRKIISELINNLVKKYEFNLTKNTLISTEMSMLNSIMIPKQLAIKDFEHDKTKIGRVIEIMERMKIGIEVGSIKTNTRMRSGYIRYNKFNPDFVQGLIDKRCENYSGGMFRGGNRNRDDEDGDGDGDDGENNLNEIKAIPYINAINEMYKIEKKLQVDNEKLKRKRIEDSENESGVGMISSSSSGGDKRGISTVEFFKRQYSTFHSQLSKENNNVQEKGESNVGKHADVRSVGAGGSESAGDGSSSSSGVMSDNSNRIWVKYHEGFSNAVRKELTWQTLFKG